MKLATYVRDGREEIGRLSPDLRAVWPLSQFGFPQPDMNAFLDAVTADELAGLAAAETASVSVPWAEVKKRAPIPAPRQDILCLGMNFPAHLREAVGYDRAAFERERGQAVYFSKRVSEAVPDGGVIPAHADLTEKLDYEAELAVVLGRDARNVMREDVPGYIFGYTVINDVSARDLQTRHKQFTFGKSLDGFAPMGPWLVTADEFPFPLRQRIRCWVNGELRQDGAMDQAYFGVDEVVAELSRGMTLRRGTILAMGTPAGVGMGFTPPRFLRPGDVVRCEVEGIGAITNTVR